MEYFIVSLYHLLIYVHRRTIYIKYSTSETKEVTLCGNDVFDFFFRMSTQM